MVDAPSVASVYFPKFKEDLPNVEGKVFLITGTTSGTGFVAAQTVAEKGGEVVCLNRKSQRVIDSTEKLRKAVPTGKFVNIECDLQDFESAKKAVEVIKSSYDKIYCLSCNAGIMMTEDKATKDGCDTQMQTNHLTHFLLTKELFPLLEKEANANGDARVVYHSSEARNMLQTGLEKKYFEKKGGELGGNGGSLFQSGGRTVRYGQSKLANSVMMYAMHEKLEKRGSKVRVMACHPGGSATNLGEDVPFSCFEKILMKLVMKFIIQSGEDGTMGLLTGMMVPDAKSGVLYGPLGSGRGTLIGPAVPNPPQPHENDPNAMAMLWEVSEETTGVKFEI